MQPLHVEQDVTVVCVCVVRACVCMCVCGVYMCVLCGVY